MCSSPPGIGPVEVRRVGRDRLAGGRAGQQSQEHAQVLRPRDQLLDAHAGDVQLGQRDAQVGVAFVRADDEAAGLGDGEVHARDARRRRP